MATKKKTTSSKTTKKNTKTSGTRKTNSSKSKSTNNSTKNKSTKSTSKKSASSGVNEVKTLDPEQLELIKDIILWASILIGLLLFIGNIGFGGVVGGAFSGFFFGLFGIIAYLLPLIIIIGTFFIISNLGNKKMVNRVIVSIVIALCICLFIELLTHEGDYVGPKMAYLNGYENKAGGGFFGGLFAAIFVKGFGLIGAYLIDIILLVISFVVLSGVTILPHKTYNRKQRRRRYNDANEARNARLDRIERDKLAQEEQLKVAAESDRPRRERKISGVAFDTSITEGVTPISDNSDDINEVSSGMADVEVADVNRIPLKSRMKSRSEISQESKEPTPVVSNANTDDLINTHEQKTRKPQKTAQSQAEVAASTNAVNKEIKNIAKKSKSNYKMPPLNLLVSDANGGGGMTKDKINETADKLEKTLKNFGINATVENATCGPSVTRYEIKPEDGVRVNRITNLADDIKLNLAVSDIRIEAPIPGKAAVGIEVPNPKRASVGFKEIVDSKEFKKAESKVSFTVGKDIAGSIIIANLAKMPHLLIAGTTGSGKSVLTNSIIMSILYKATPDEVKFIMIDPKVVEFSVYNGIPHLLLPVVTDPKKAAGALNWAVTEMNRRYQMFAQAGARDIKSFNDKIIKNGGSIELPINNQGETESVGKMSEIVIIVDELADLMMAAAKEVEESICRLAQKARAAGMYMILATQRPSVDVVTGLIKANMPSRIALSVNSGIDSRTIIDMNGAENLLGNGDMLYYPQSLTKPVRVQGAFVRTEEIQQVVDYIKDTNVDAEYDENIIKAVESEGGASGNSTSIDGGGSGFDDDQDQYFADAGRLIISKQKGSIGMLQRNFRIGFNRAARIMDQLEMAGVVGPELGTKPRTVTMSLTDFEIYLNPNYVPTGSDDGDGGILDDEYPVNEDID
ncbi:MAG: DNA translocase FtsK [Lachnospiraceae bacterium]|nr:DNA translocase FtsK [Lachnospiraceae bacterium]